jgi:3-methyladenine DNA glycosylase/8-oxoguanine DNA glycosylase
MSNRLRIPTPEKFNFRTAVCGHGWYDLPPFRYDEQAGTLRYAYYSRSSGKAVAFTAAAKRRYIDLTIHSAAADAAECRRVAQHIVRLDEDLEDFYRSIEGVDALAWAREHNAGRLLRSGTVFEDLVKTMCTTNCSWGLTRSMTANLVEKLGEEAEGGLRAFPTPEAMAAVDAGFYRSEVKAGYRSPYLLELAQAVAASRLDPESWLDPTLPTPELRKVIKEVKGIGDYAADNLLKLLGRYDGLALDSWLRSGYAKRYNRGKPCPDKKIEKHYKKFGKWRGLAIWCDMTRDWFGSEGKQE